MTSSLMTNTDPATTTNSQSYATNSESKYLDTSKSLSEKDKKACADWVTSQYHKMKNNRQRIRRKWDMHLEWYGGNQYVQLLTGGNPILSKVGTRGGPRSRERSVTNRIRPMMRTEITRMTSQKPTVSIIPASAEDDDLFAAQSGEAVWEFLYQFNRMQWVMERNAFWTALCGNGFIKTYWDPDDISANLKTDMGVPAQGNVKIGAVTPYNIFVPDLLCEDIEEQPHVFEAYTRTAEWASRFFGQDFQPSVVAKSEIFESQYFQGTGDNPSSLPDSVLIIEAYVKPGSCKMLKEGGLVTLVGDQLVRYVDHLPYSHNEYPYAHTKHVPNGKFYADSVLEDIIPIQRQLNKVRSQIIESYQRVGRPQIFAPLGTMDVSKYTSEPGLVVQYKPALGKPEFAPPPNIPNYILNDVERLISDMEDISGQHQVSRGMAPGQGVVAATAIAYLQEKDEAVISQTISSIEQAVSKIGRQALTLVVDYWDLPRIVRVAGTDKMYDSFALKGSDIANGTDLRTDAGSGLPLSKAAQQALLMDLYTQGAITKEQMLDMMQIGGVQNLVDRMRIDMRAAQRENMRMKKLTPQEIEQFAQEQMQNAMQGGPGSTDPNSGLPTVDPANYSTYPPIVKVNDWDNHAVHITVHNNYRKGQEFETLDPAIQDMFAKHIAIHQNYVYMQGANPAMGAAQAGAPNSAMGMMPEGITGPDASGGQPPMPGAGPQQQQPPMPM